MVLQMNSPPTIHHIFTLTNDH